MGSKKTKTTSNQTATTTPNLNPAASNAIDNYYSGVGQLQGLPSSSVVTNPNPYQLGAASQTANLLSQLSAKGGFNAVQPSAYSASKVGNIDAPTAATATVADYDPVALASDTSGLAGKDVATYGGASARPYMDQYMNPLLSDYVDATMADYWDNAGRQQADYERLGALNKGLGGSSYAIGKAELDANLNRGAASTRAGLYSDAWNKALGAGQSDAANATSAGIASMQAQNQRDETLASLASQLGMFNAGAQNDRSQSIFDALNQLGMFNAGQENDLLSQIYGEQNENARQDAAAQNDVLSQIYGGTLSNNQFNAQQALNQKNAAIQAAGLLGDMGNDLYSIDRQNQLAPYTQAQILADLINGGGILGTTTGQTATSSGTSTTKESGGLLGQLLGPLAQLGSAAITKSERRVKRDIVKIGQEPDGLGVYRFRYIWDDDDAPVNYGVMRDEVARFRPWALGPVVDGVGTVDYAKLETM